MPWEVASVLRCNRCNRAFEMRVVIAPKPNVVQSLPWETTLRTPDLPVGWSESHGEIGCPMHPVGMLFKPRGLSVVK